MNAKKDVEPKQANSDGPVLGTGASGDLDAPDLSLIALSKREAERQSAKADKAEKPADK